MFLILIESDLIFQKKHLTVNLSSDIAFLPHLFQQILMAAFFLTDHRCHDHDAGSFRKLHHLIKHLLDGLGSDRNVVVRTVRYAYSGIHKSQIVIYFGNCSDS